MSDLKIQKVEQCVAIRKLHSNPNEYLYAMEQSGWRFRKPTTKDMAEYAIKAMEAAVLADAATHAANAEALSVNAEIRGEIEALMESVGMPKRFSYRDSKSRARFPKTISEDAGYITDLRREVATNDGYQHSLDQAERLRQGYEKFLADAIREDEDRKRQAERAAEAEKERRLANVELAEIILRYGLDREADWSDVLEALRAKDQRLDLAMAMQETRGDWSEGFYRVENALGRFKIETDEDKDIAADICGCLRCDDTDGRIFRDTEWNYSRLFASVADQQLAKDAQLADSRILRY